MILLRTHQFDEQTRAFCEKLQDESELEVICLIDESRETFDTSPFPKISVTPDAIFKLGLHCPKDFQWRCGDYGLYLAQKLYLEQEKFWLVEYDVRFHSDAPIRNLFQTFEASGADLVAPMFGKRHDDWWWYASMSSRGQPVYGCLFPMLRISAKLIQMGLMERRRQSRSAVHRLFWPNDESFIATVAMRGGMSCQDLNTGQIQFYTTSSFSFEGVHSGESLDASPTDNLLYHPVLYGANYKKKRTRLKQKLPFTKN